VFRLCFFETHFVASFALSEDLHSVHFADVAKAGFDKLTGFINGFSNSRSVFVSFKAHKLSVEQSVFNRFVTKPLICQIYHSKLGNAHAHRKVTEYLMLATNSRQGKAIVDKIDRQFSDVLVTERYRAC
jgi:hypothetical protein